MIEDNICVAVIHPQRFMADSIASLLMQNDFNVVARATNIEALTKVSLEREPAICLLGADHEDFEEVAADLRRKFPKSRLVLVDSADAADLFQLAHDHGLDGCMSLDLSAELLASGLRLVVEGVGVFPCSQVAGERLDMKPIPRSRSSVLTPREFAVLNLIGKGMSNKVIARELVISESTVKAHLNSVLRKTGTANRTEAARWAFDNGQIAC